VYLTSDDVQDILRLLDSLPFGELHLRTESFSLSLCRAAGGGWTQATEVLTPPRMADPVRPAADQAGPPVTGPANISNEPGAGVPSPADGLVEVRAPLPGTFYRAPRPGSPPFVELGSRVGADTVVGIIETMKLMNSVYAGRGGTVAELCVADAEFAAQDAVLIRIGPAAQIDPGARADPRPRIDPGPP